VLVDYNARIETDDISLFSILTAMSTEGPAVILENSERDPINQFKLRVSRGRI
jgi:hypothetical protein